MDGFSYTDIFETKGLEYLVIIIFLLLIIPFWYILNRRKQAAVMATAQSEAFIPGLRIPLGIFFSRNHTWAYLESSGIVKTGIDDFLLRITGNMDLKILRTEGEVIKKGDLIAEISQNSKKLRIISPVSGKISGVNSNLSGEILLKDPYGEAWIYKLTPADWKSETQSYLLADETKRWLKSEALRFRDMVAGYLTGQVQGNAMPVLQDGGELIGNPLSDLPGEAWTLFEKSFLTLDVGN